MFAVAGTGRNPSASCPAPEPPPSTPSIQQPTLSQQLGVLRGEGAVATRRDGKNVFYSVADAELLQVLTLLNRLHCIED